MNCQIGASKYVKNVI